LRFFAGLTLDEAADALGVSRRKAAKDWSVARLWLRRELGGGA
jgi:DNA-directed RNA polymerase specialized sigma24 family protein